MKTENRMPLFLAALLLMSLTAASCGDTASAPQNNTESAAIDGSTVLTDDTAAEESTRIKANLPARDFGGETINFYARRADSTVWDARDILSETTDGEPINDALYERTVYIEDTYNVKLAVMRSEADDITAKAKSMVTAGDTSAQVFVSSTYNAGALAIGQCLMDLNTVENIDLSQRWWAQSTDSYLSLCGGQFYATGDIFIIDNEGIRVFFFNKDLIRDYDLESPYSLVHNNKWTVEKYVEYSETVQKDLDGDNVMNRKYDQYGTMAQTTLGQVLYFAAGEHLTVKDEDDIPCLATGSERALSVMIGISEKINGAKSISQDGTASIGINPDNIYYFQEGRVLFAPEVLLHIETMRGCDVDIGIIPPPKYEQSQDKYYCYADGYCVNVVSIPVTNTEAEKAGFILEAMAADSLNNLTPAFYDICLKEKYVRDEESVEMLDLILDSVVMDNANIFAWGGLETKVGNLISKGGAIASALEKNHSSAQKGIDKAVGSILEIMD